MIEAAPEIQPEPEEKYSVCFRATGALSALKAMKAHAVALGIDVAICRHSFLHAKMAIVDGRRVVVGSANLDARSFNVNREIMVSTMHRGVCAEAMSFVERLMRLSTPPTSRELRCRLPNFIVRMLKPLL